MKRLTLVPMLLLSLPLCGIAQNAVTGNPEPGIAFSPAPGTAPPGQSVTVTATGTWPSVPTIFCTTDGTPANIAATLVGSIGSGGGTIAVLEGPDQTSETLSCIAALGAVTYQNVNASETGWKTCIGNLNYASNGTPAATCSGGVGKSYPSSWDYVWGPTFTQQMTGGKDVQILATFSADVCPLCNQPAGTQIMMAQSKIVTATADSTILSNNEMDMQASDATNTIGGVPVEHNFGLQCEQASPASNPGYWAIDGAGKWIPTTISNSCPWPVNTPIEVVAQGWWALGDTGCGGNGCFHVISLTINGTVYDLSGTVWESGLKPGTLAQPGQPGWGSFFGLQDQMDLTPAGGTAGRTVSNANVTEAYYTANPVIASATYSTTGSATIVSPAPGSTLPGSSVNFAWAPAPGAAAYALNLAGTGRRASHLYTSGNITATSVAVTGLPTDGSTINAQLWALVNNAWVVSDYTFTAAPTAAAAMISPAPGSTLNASGATFSWSQATGATAYALSLGSMGPGSSDIYNSGAVSTTSVNVATLPTNGEPVYAELYYEIAGVWYNAAYMYTAGQPPVSPAAPLSPVAN
jgi:hypothetical protein